MSTAALRIERNLVVPMRDGVRLFANLYRPLDDRPRPVIISAALYGKDKLPTHGRGRLCRTRRWCRWGRGGAISIYVADDADVFFDINGYFAPYLKHAR